jgi:hypothetical protein
MFSEFLLCIFQMEYKCFMSINIDNNSQGNAATPILKNSKMRL